jgi:hypothetical protein
MISNHSPKIIQNLANNIFSISLRSHGMKEFGVFIPKLRNPLSESLSPIFSLHKE